MQFIDGIPVWGGPDDSAVPQINICAQTPDRVALLDDHHQGLRGADRRVLARVSHAVYVSRPREVAALDRRSRIAGTLGNQLSSGRSLRSVFVGLDFQLALGFLGHQVRADEWFEIAVENFVDIPDFKLGAMVLD